MDTNCNMQASRISCWLCVIQKNHFVIYVHFKVFKHDIFLIVMDFVVTWKWEYTGLIKRHKKWRSKEILFFAKSYLAIQTWHSNQWLQHGRKKIIKSL